MFVYLFSGAMMFAFILMRMDGALIDAMRVLARKEDLEKLDNCPENYIYILLFIVCILGWPWLLIYLMKGPY